jgi:hypothetical protein
MPPPIIATIASSQLFPISTGGSAYFYPKILDSNGAALSSESNADGNGNSFGHFYKNLLSSSGCVIVSNVLTFCNVCNYIADSNAMVSLWTSNGKYLQVPLVGPTYTTIRKETMKKEGIVINTVSTNNFYSTIMTYGPTAPSNFMFKEGTYSTFMPQNYNAVNYNFSFADAVYLNYHKTGLEVLFTTNDNVTGAVTISGNDWLSPTNPTNYYLNYPNRSTNINVFGDLSIEAACSNASGTLLLNLSMCNLAPFAFLRGADVAEIDGIAYPNISNFSNVTICNFNAIAFPGDAYVSNYFDGINTLESGSVCIYSQIDPAGNSYSNEGKFSLFNFGDSYSYETDSKNDEDIITFGPNTVNHTLPTHPVIEWNLATVTFSNYVKNRSNYYDLYTYYNANLQYSNLTNAGHTSSFISNYITIGSNYPGVLMNIGLFDRCLCKREIELYIDVVYKELAGGGGGSGSGSASGSGSGSGGGGGSEEPPPS